MAKDLKTHTLESNALQLEVSNCFIALSNKLFSAGTAEIVTLKYLESPADAVTHVMVKPSLSDNLTLLLLLQARRAYEKRMRKWFPISAPHLRGDFPEILSALPAWSDSTETGNTTAAG
jgi:hypothetical protein